MGSLREGGVERRGSHLSGFVQHPLPPSPPPPPLSPPPAPLCCTPPFSYFPHSTVTWLRGKHLWEDVLEKCSEIRIFVLGIFLILISDPNFVLCKIVSFFCCSYLCLMTRLIQRKHKMKMSKFRNLDSISPLQHHQHLLLNILITHCTKHGKKFSNLLNT